MCQRTAVVDQKLVDWIKDEYYITTTVFVIDIDNH